MDINCLINLFKTSELHRSRVDVRNIDINGGEEKIKSLWEKPGHHANFKVLKVPSRLNLFFVYVKEGDKYFTSKEGYFPGLKQSYDDAFFSFLKIFFEKKLNLMEVSGEERIDLRLPIEKELNWQV